MSRDWYAQRAHRSHVSASRITHSPIYAPMVERSVARIVRRLGFKRVREGVRV